MLNSNDKLQLFKGDCLEVMKGIASGSIDMILCDLPYGTTACSWDIVIPFDRLWEQYKRIIKDNGAIVLFARQPFMSDLVNSNRQDYRYEIIWDKNTSTDFAQANNKPITVHENIAVFYKKKARYNRIDLEGFKAYSDSRTVKKSSELGAKGCVNRQVIKNKTSRCPTTIMRHFPDNKKGFSYHSCQKPVDLLERLIRMFTKEGDVVLDNCMGSGSTGEACGKTNRGFYGIEKEEKTFNIAYKRLHMRGDGYVSE